MKDMLSGMKVLDFTTNAAGPTCTAMLSDYGASVIKVERPNGDDNRTFPPLVDGQSVVHCWVNRGKKSVTLDLNTPEGLEIAKKLALEADVLCESYRPGIMDKFGLGYEALKQEKPQIIYCAISAYGLSGPYAKKPGYDLIAQATSGLIDLIGDPEGTPLKSGIVIGDYWGGVNAFSGVVTAWYHFLNTGEGQLVDASLVQNLVYLNSAILEANVGVKGTRKGNHDPDHSPYGVFRGKGEQFAVVAVESDDEWRKFATLMGRDDLASAPERVRVASRDIYTQAVEQWLGTFDDIADAVAKVEALAIVSCVVGTMRVVAADAHILANEWIVDVPLPKGVTSKKYLRSRAVHASFSKTPGRPKQAPLLGQHTMEVLCSIGYEPAYVESLQEKWRESKKG